jgi:hypothetical protein
MLGEVLSRSELIGGGLLLNEMSEAFLDIGIGTKTDQKSEGSFQPASTLTLQAKSPTQGSLRGAKARTLGFDKARFIETLDRPACSAKQRRTRNPRSRSR